MADPKPAAGQLGPRMLGRLTPELILRSPQYMNPVNQYEIDLRANRVAAIENLGATEVRAPLGGLRGARGGGVARGGGGGGTARSSLPPPSLLSVAAEPVR